MENNQNISLTAAPVHCHVLYMDIPLRSGSPVGYSND